MSVIVDAEVLPGLLLLAAELTALAAVGFVVVRVALQQKDELSALAQGLVVGPALWGIVVNFVMYVVPGLTGAAVGWGVVLVLVGVLAWKSPHRVRPTPRTVAGFCGAIVVLGWAALASRQLLAVAADLHVSLGLAASIRAGGFPVTQPWQPETAASYHYGASLLTGLLAPPRGPDLSFVWELMGVYAWVSFAMVVGTALLGRGSWLGMLALAPLLLSPGVTTSLWYGFSRVAGILSFPVPAGLPATGLPATLASIWWGPVEAAGTRLGSIPDVWRPAFPMGYALAFVVVAHAARSSRHLAGSVTLAGLVGFLGILVTTLVPVVVLLWAGLEFLHLVRARRAGAAIPAPALRSGAGLAVAGSAAAVWRGCVFGDSGQRYGLIWLSLGWPCRRQPLVRTRRLRDVDGRRWAAACGTGGGGGRGSGAGAARPAGAGAGDRRWSAGAGLAGTRLCAATPGS